MTAISSPLLTLPVTKPASMIQLGTGETSNSWTLLLYFAPKKEETMLE